MGRIHTHRHGKSHSIRPVTLGSSWVSQNSEQVKELVEKYAKEDLSPSQIGIKLRDQHAIPLVKAITKKTLMQILQEKKLKPELPEDLDNIIKKAAGCETGASTLEETLQLARDRVAYVEANPASGSGTPYLDASGILGSTIIAGAIFGGMAAALIFKGRQGKYAAAGRG